MKCFFHQYKAITLCTLFVALAGCGLTGTTAPSQFYILSPLSESMEKAQMSWQAQSIAVAVGPVEVAEYLNRPQIVTRLSPNELKLAEFNKWAESLKDNISRIFVENLSTLLSTEAIAVFPWRGSTPIDYRAEVEVLRLDGVLGGNATLVARWAVYQEEEGEMLFAKKSIVQEAVDGQSYEALVSAQSRAIGALSHEIAEKISELIKPVAKAAGVSKKQPNSEREGFYYEVRRGDTLFKISIKYGVSVDAICRFNNITKDQPIYPGQRILIAPKK